MCFLFVPAAGLCLGTLGLTSSMVEVLAADVLEADDLSWTTSGAGRFAPLVELEVAQTFCCEDYTGDGAVC